MAHSALQWQPVAAKDELRAIDLPGALRVDEHGLCLCGGELKPDARDEAVHYIDGSLKSLADLVTMKGGTPGEKCNVVGMDSSMHHVGSAVRDVVDGAWESYV